MIEYLMGIALILLVLFLVALYLFDHYLDRKLHRINSDIEKLEAQIKRRKEQP